MLRCLLLAGTSVLLAAGCGRAAETPALAVVGATEWVLPGEHEPVERLLLAWDDGFEGLQAEMIEVALAYTDVTVVVDPGVGAASVAHRLAERGLLRPSLALIEQPLDLPWIRDFGPLVVRSSGGARRVVDARYFQEGPEDSIPGLLAGALQIAQVVDLPLEIEGGNLLSDGRGRCVTAAGYVDADDPVSGLDADEVRRQLRRHLGCREVVIVPPLFGERTGHVDLLVTLTGPGEAMVGRYDIEQDPINALRLDEAAARLVDAGFLVRRVPMPDNHDDVFRSYTNSIAINGAVLVPVYDDDRRVEAEAFDVFRAAYPDRDLVAIESTEAMELDGALHCLTMTVAR